MLIFRELSKVIENELAFAAGVAGIDDFVDVLARDQFFQVRENVLRLVDRLELEFFRNDRQRLESPEAVFLLVDVLWHEQFRDMADRRGDDVFVVLEVVAFLRDFAERAREVRGDAGFLGDDE